MTVSPRILILGNSGSGKTWLANRLARHFAIPAIELDALHWMPGGFNLRRPPDDAKEAVQAAAREDGWIIEGVFGWLARQALPRATILVWLVLPEEECIRNLINRPIKSGEDPDARSALLQWCSEYRTRTNANSYAGHRDIHEAFTGEKHRLCTRDEIETFLSTVNRG
ncbi:MAG: hypothetical protein ABF854_19360 [Gluconacetobacter sp.]